MNFLLHGCRQLLNLTKHKHSPSVKLSAFSEKLSKGPSLSEFMVNESVDKKSVLSENHDSPPYVAQDFTTDRKGVHTSKRYF